MRALELNEQLGYRSSDWQCWIRPSRSGQDHTTNHRLILRHEIPDDQGAHAVAKNEDRTRIQAMVQLCEHGGCILANQSIPFFEGKKAQLTVVWHRFTMTGLIVSQDQETPHCQISRKGIVSLAMLRHAMDDQQASKRLAGWPV